MHPSARIVALLIALMMHRSGKVRGRISEKTLRWVSRRSTLRTAFMSELVTWLADLGVVAVALDRPRGGYALVAISALAGAPSLLARDHIADELKNAIRGNLDEAAIWKELGYEENDEEE
jgi:hypothetical protein